jgi:ligand-binding sensor domain-containing protein/signal transduction histidine kinase
MDILNDKGIPLRPITASEYKKNGAGLCVALALLLFALAGSARAERLPFKSYTTADGLGSTYILSIVQDSHGFLWFCTRDGLSRFDGRQFVTYNIEHGLPQPTINHLLQTRSGVYWVATNGGGVCRFDPNAGLQLDEAGTDRLRPVITSAAGKDASLFTSYPIGDEPYLNYVNVLYEDRAGQIWAGTDVGLFRLEESDRQVKFHRVELPHPNPSAAVWAFIEDREAGLWIGTSSGLVRRLPDGRMIHHTVHPFKGADIVTALLEDREGRLWIGHSIGLILFNPVPASQLRSNEGRLQIAGFANRLRTPKSEPLNTGDARLYTTADGLADNLVMAICQTSDGRIWIGTDGGLSVYDGQRFRSYTTPQGLSANRIRGLAEDRNGNLWLGTTLDGAIRLALNGCITYTEADDLGDSAIHSIHASQSGELFAVSGAWLINRFDGKRFNSQRLDVPRDATRYWNSQAGFLDREGEWWALTTKGLCRYGKISHAQHLAHKSPQAVYTSRDGLANDSAIHIFEDARGDLWIGSKETAPSTLTRWERATETFHTYTEADGLPPSNGPTSFCQDASGRLWIGFSTGGLARYEEGRFTLFTTTDGLPAGGILALHLDGAGRLWAATTGGGLARIDDSAAARPRFVTYTTADGLSSNNLRCITEDERGHIYIGTVRGVDRLNPETGHIKHYTTDDGLANDFVTSAFSDRAGAVWFGTLNGLSRLVPEPETAQLPSPVLIGGLRIAGIRQPFSELGEAQVAGLELEPNQNQIQIDYFGVGFEVGEALLYQFKLEGADREWSGPTIQRTVNYASLASGSYRFLVRAIGADGVPGLSPASVAFRILPPIWRRWWFVTIAALIFASAVFAFARYRYQRMKAVREAEEALQRSREERLVELERVRTRIATDLHDDIGSSLTRISLLSEVVQRRVDATTAPVAESLTVIARLSRELVDSMSDIVWAINPNKDHLSDLSQRMRHFASDVFTARQIDFCYRAPDAEHDIKIGANVRRELFLIFKEAVNNIVRHSECTRAEIEFRADSDRLFLRLSENGRGFDVTQKSDGHGLVSMRERTVGLGGALEIVSQAGQGTTLTFAIPLVRQDGEKKSITT